ncbi:MAG: DUF6473 family protein [Paracoccaceae bacterium]
MAYEHGGDRALDYYPCRYGQSKLLFRGPRRNLDGDYLAVLGGTLTYGKFVQKPYPALIEDALGLPVVNLGYMNAGADVFLGEPAIIDMCRQARATVIQLMGAQNMSNRYYAVHPRRNDRFLRASQLMKSIFREIDFTEFHFTRHMLFTLKMRSAEKFDLLEQELKAAWVARMTSLLQRVSGSAVLLWVGDYRNSDLDTDDLGSEPLLVDDDMVAAILPYASGLVRVGPSDEARSAGQDGMFFSPLEEPIARELPGPKVHEEVAAALAAELAGTLLARPLR